MPIDPGLLLAIKAAGSERKLAQLIGLSQQAVNQWRGKVPLNRVIEVEQATGVPREELRPDFFRRPAALTCTVGEQSG